LLIRERLLEGRARGMTALHPPSFELRLFRLVADEVEAEPVRAWPRESFKLCLGILRRLRLRVAHLPKLLDATLAEGVESHSFTRAYAPARPAAEKLLSGIRDLLGKLSPTSDDQTNKLVAELRAMERHAREYLDLLDNALARAAAPPRPIDEERVLAAREAFSGGETKIISRP
jgi:hypothetical protein